MGTTSSFFGGGGGSPLPEPEWLFQKSSYTYTFPYDGVVLVHVIGAGGSGGCQFDKHGATGGGAGGYSRKQFTVTSSTTATVTTGVGGSYVGPSQTEVEGNAGTNSTFVLSSTTLTANGGGAGQRYGGATSTGTGGTASGGDVNYTGGDGGTRGYAYNEERTIATGGGAVNLFGLASGEVNGGNNGSNQGGGFKATGGGGVGGHGGNIPESMSYVATGGGGSAGSARDMTNTDASGYGGQKGSGGAGGARLFRFGGPFLDGVGGVGIQTIYNGNWGFERNVFTTIGMGAGSGGCTTNTDNDNPLVNSCQQAGIFGGGGGLVTGQAYGGVAGDAIIGGGGGGATYYSSSSTQGNLGRRSGQGGDGVVIIEYIERT